MPILRAINDILFNLNHTTVSTRGLRAAKSIARIDLEVYFEALQNLFDPLENPTGALPLNMAENKLCWHMLESKIKDITTRSAVPTWVAGYTDPMGEASVREAVAGFLSRHLTKCPIEPELIGLSAGASSVIELTSYILAESGDVAVIPAPSYPVYKQDLGTVGQMERHDLVIHHHLTEQTESRLSVSHLEKTLDSIKDQGKHFRMLILTQPDNPTGIIYSEEELRTFSSWCIDQKIHLVVNEIYGLSLIDTQHPDLQNLYDRPQSFYSFANILHESESPYLHLWYAFSKDFGISGFRVGLIYSKNEWFWKGFANLNIGHMVSNYVQWLLREILRDDQFVTDYIHTNQKLLTESVAIVIKKMQELDIPFIAPRGSLFVWIDLSEFLVTLTQEAENKFWMEVFRSTGILLTPGSGFGHSKRGQFRIVCTFLQKSDLKIAMSKLGAYVVSIRNSK